MPKRFPWIVSAIALLVCAMVLPSAVMAQYGQSTGGIDGKVVDEQGGVLPGVSVTVTGAGRAADGVHGRARRVSRHQPGDPASTR